MGKPENRKDCKLLDIGCGKDVPLARMLFTSRMASDGLEYVGMDYNKLEMPDAFKNTKWQPTLLGQSVFPEAPTPHEKYNVITCFEVLEHVEPLHAFKMLQGFKDKLAENGFAFISTPLYDPQVGAAANHVNEMGYRTMELMLALAGFDVDDHFGTFASIKDYKDLIEQQDLTKVFNRLREYYDTNYLATIFAPLYPHKARNVLWRIKHAPPILTEAAEYIAELKTIPENEFSSSKERQPLIDHLEKTYA
jgi:2-polyprenyl-3-methyl-5-hydroxy-6-metoxy-1,4-benzoquinol methylase